MDERGHRGRRRGRAVPVNVQLTVDGPACEELLSEIAGCGYVWFISLVT